MNHITTASLIVRGYEETTPHNRLLCPSPSPYWNWNSIEPSVNVLFDFSVPFDRPFHGTGWLTFFPALRCGPSMHSLFVRKITSTLVNLGHMSDVTRPVTFVYYRGTRRNGYQLMRDEA